MSWGGAEGSEDDDASELEDRIKQLILEAAKESSQGVSAAESTSRSDHMVSCFSVAVSMHMKFIDLLNADSAEGSTSEATGRADACRGRARKSTHPASFYCPSVVVSVLMFAILITTQAVCR